MIYDEDGIAVGPVVIRACSASEFPLSELDECFMEMHGTPDTITVTWHCPLCGDTHTSRVRQ